MNEKRKQTIRYCPFAYYNAECLQMWLEKQAAHGLVLSGSGFIGPFAIMNRESPRDCRYRIIPMFQRTSDDTIYFLTAVGQTFYRLSLIAVLLTLLEIGVFTNM